MQDEIYNALKCCVINIQRLLQAVVMLSRKCIKIFGDDPEGELYILRLSLPLQLYQQAFLQVARANTRRIKALNGSQYFQYLFFIRDHIFLKSEVIHDCIEFS